MVQVPLKTPWLDILMGVAHSGKQIAIMHTTVQTDEQMHGDCPALCCARLREAADCGGQVVLGHGKLQTAAGRLCGRPRKAADCGGQVVR